MPGPHTAFTKVPAPGTGLLVRCVDDSSEAGAVRMLLTGELSFATADDVREAIQREQRGARHVICDLTEISFIDVPGVCMLIDLAARAPHTGDRLTVANPPRIFRSILRLFGLTEELVIDAHPAPSTGAPREPSRSGVTHRAPRRPDH